jgi:hypothetical protein
MTAHLSVVDELQNDFPSERKLKHYMNFLYRQLLISKYIHMDFIEEIRISQDEMS